MKKVKTYRHNLSQATTSEKPRLREHPQLSHDLDSKNELQGKDFVLEKNPKSWSNFREEKLPGYASGLCNTLIESKLDWVLFVNRYWLYVL